jgi:citrate lyase subunit beta/citryl-CoA lyase
MEGVQKKALELVRRSKLFVPVNREKFVAKAWTRGADGIILDLEDAIAPADKVSARKMVKDVIPMVNKGGAEILVRINREFEAEDLDAIVIPGLTCVMIPKCESVEEIRRIAQMVTRLERERGLPEGRIEFELIIETAVGVVNVESIVKASPRIMQVGIGQGDLSVNMGFPRFPELNFEQYFYAENKLLYAARAAKVQACGLGAQNTVDFTSVSMGEEAMLKACRHACLMGYQGAAIIHPGWCQSVNEGFKPSKAELAMAQKVKMALDEGYAQGKGSVTVDGRMYDVANMKHVQYILRRAEAIARREAEKMAALAKTGGIQ